MNRYSMGHIDWKPLVEAEVEAYRIISESNARYAKISLYLMVIGYPLAIVLSVMTSYFITKFFF